MHSALRKALWFIALWLVGVATLGSVAAMIRIVLFSG